MQLRSDSIGDGQLIPADYAFGRLAEDAPMALSGNRNPHLAWSGFPAGTRSFAVLCVDDDVPTDPALVNREDRTIPVDHERCDFYHWVLIDLDPSVTEIAAGACSDGVSVGGKGAPTGPPGSRQGLNDYTGFMAGSDMAGAYFGYDGPCPPWNDERLHHYHFRVYALDVDRLEVEDRFDGRAVAEAMAGHVLDQAEITGTYTLNPALVPR